MISVVVISLRRSTERRDAVRAQLDRLSVAFRFHDATDGNLLSEAEATRLCPRRSALTRRFIMSRHEVACLESHKACLEEARVSGAAFTCILEDDARLSGDFAEFLDQPWLESLAALDILKFGGDGPKRQDERALVVGTHRGSPRVRTIHPTYSAIGYVVSRSGAQKALDHMRKIQDTVDKSLFRRPAANARILDVHPFPVVPAHTQSTINHEPGFKDVGPWWRPYASWLPIVLQ